MDVLGRRGQIALVGSHADGGGRSRPLHAGARLRERLRACPACLDAALVLLVLTPIVVPFIQSGYPWGHDTPAHLVNTYRFDRAFWGGQFPVRWVEGLRPGAGQPLFNFYQVGFYYFVEALHALGATLSAAFKLAPVLLWAAGSLFMWAWLRPFGRWAAIAGSVTFALSPYVILDVFVRAAYPEFMAIVCVAGVLWAGEAFLRTGRTAYVPAVVGFVALLLVAHLPACLIAAPLLIGQLLMRGLRDEPSRSRLPTFLVAAALGGGAAAFYVVPALWELDLVNLPRLTTGGLDYRDHFVPASTWRPRLTFEWNYFGSMVNGADSLLPLQISLVQWTAMMAATLWIVVRARRRAGHAPFVLLWLTVIAYALFMTHRVSSGVWASIPHLAVVQFPWRFVMLISVAAAGLTAAMTSRLRGDRAQRWCALLVIGFHLSIYSPYLQPGDYVSRANLDIDDPRLMANVDWPPREFEEPGYDPAGTSPIDGVARRWTAVGAARVEVLAQTDDDITLRTSADEPVVVRLNIPRFPGWRLTVDDEPATMSIAGNGYMLVTVPPGTHRVRAVFENTPIRTAADATSVLSVVLAAVVTIRYRRRSATAERLMPAG